MKRLLASIGLLFIAVAAFAQLVEYPIPSFSARRQSSNKSARTQAVEDPTFLPFWDDFSASDTTLRDSLWLYGNSVLLNNGMGISPPSKNVISFDGADSLGRPYDVNDVLAKGFADRITSQPIRMDLVDVSLRSTVYLSFFLQKHGRGEPPDPGDNLIVEIKDQNGVWEDLYVIEASDTLDDSLFYQVILPISDPKYFHDTFQFRFLNFARLSGQYDNWNVDYIYLHKGRSAADKYYPDRTTTTEFTSLFKDYFAIPVKHFLEDPDANLTHPTIELNNLLDIFPTTGLVADQGINYTTSAHMTTSVGSIVNPPTVIPLNTELEEIIPALSRLNVTLDAIPAAADFDEPLADSIGIELRYFMNTKDNIFTTDPLVGDYDSIKYYPVDFRHSDTTRATYVLSTYYAYDDGKAEYVAGLNNAGTFVAFLFTMKSAFADTLTYVDIYFPEFGDNTSQSLQLQVRTTLSENTDILSFQENIQVNRTTGNKFTRYTLYRPILVSGEFYIGWKQLSNSSTLVGLDKNTDNGHKIFYNTNGVWVENTLVKGSPMVRPGFGYGNQVITSLAAEPEATMLYPNPTKGTCYLKGHPESLEVYDIRGKKVDVEYQSSGDDTRITFTSNISGLVIVKYVAGGKVFTRKLMVLAE